MNDLDLFSFKDLEEVYLKLTYPIEANGRVYEEGEVIAYFDKIQLASIHEEKTHVSARGGFDNRDHVFWDTTRDVKFYFTQGIFSSTYFGLMSNSKVIEKKEDEIIWFTQMEEMETDERGHINLQGRQYRNLFVYKADTGERLIPYAHGHDIYCFDDYPFTDVVVMYEKAYASGASLVQIGQRFLNGFLSLEGKTRVKDDVTGLVRTGIIKIPKLKLVSDLSIRLGVQAGPVVASFSALGIPVGSRGDSYVCEFYFLGEDIDG